MAIGEIWDYIVQMHSAADWSSLTIFYGGIVLFLCLVVSEILRIRTRSTAHTMGERAEQLAQELKDLRQRQVRLARYTKNRLDDRSRHTEWQMEELRRRLGQVEDRIPSLYDHLEEFRSTLSIILENELGSVLQSFDSSIDTVLEQMQGQLEAGIKNIEGIKSLVRSRREARHNLLSPAEDFPGETPESGDGGEEEEAELQPVLADEEHYEDDTTPGAAELELEEPCEAPDADAAQEGDRSSEQEEDRQPEPAVEATEGQRPEAASPPAEVEMKEPDEPGAADSEEDDHSGEHDEDSEPEPAAEADEETERTRQAQPEEPEDAEIPSELPSEGPREAAA